MIRLKRRLAFLALLIAVVLAAGTLGFTFIAGYPPFDAFYMTLTTIATVGYREIHDLTTVGRIFNVFVIIVGVSTIFFAIGAMTQTVIELELGEFFGKRRMKRMIDKLEKHYIVCGYGRVGRAATRELQQAGVPIVVVDRNPEKVERATRAGLPALAADSTQDTTLEQAGVKRAKGLIAALATDADNLFLILSAKTLNPELKVAARVGEEEAEQKLRRAGADTVFAPYTNAGHHLALSLVSPHVVQFLDAATHDIGLNLCLEQMRVSAGSELASKSLKQLQLRRDLGVIVLAIRKAHGEMIFNPPAEAVLDAGDFVIAMGEHENVRKLEHMLAEVNA
ncbi:MAG TPA: NAD-binding protein [Bryobacteraceae bacterium]|nr:NAD-binding protein [Bryobacteraceae bacterium]